MVDTAIKPGEFFILLFLHHYKRLFEITDGFSSSLSCSNDGTINPIGFPVHLWGLAGVDSLWSYLSGSSFCATRVTSFIQTLWRALPSLTGLLLCLLKQHGINNASFLITRFHSQNVWRSPCCMLFCREETLRIIRTRWWFGPKEGGRGCSLSRERTLYVPCK